MFFQWMNTRTLVTIDTTERIHVIDVRSEEELEVSSRIFCAHAACVIDIQIHNSHSVIHFYRILHFLIARNLICDFRHFKKKTFWSITPLYSFNYVQGSRKAFYLIYIHSRTMNLISLERACKDDSNHTKYSKLI